MTIRYRLAEADLHDDGPWPLDETGRHYLIHVHRLEDSDCLVAFDGMGNERRVRINVADGNVCLIPEGSVTAGLAGAPLTVCYGLPKGDKLDRVARQLTELGVARLILLKCERSIVRWTDAKAAKRRERLARVVAEAARQSGRSDLMDVIGPLSIENALAAVSDESVLVFDPQGVIKLDAVGRDGPLAIIVGPEGGFSQGEISQFQNANADILTLGSLVLRTETAAPVAAALTLNHMGYL